MSVLLVCGMHTDARAWGPVLRLLGEEIRVEVVDWPSDVPADVVAAVDEVLPMGHVYDLAIGVADGSAGAVQAARLGAARRLTLIGPSGGPVMTEVDFDFASHVPDLLDGFSPEMKRLVEVVQSGDTAMYARLLADMISAQIGQEHHALVQSMALTYASAMDPEALWYPTAHPWADWLPGIDVPITLVFNEAASVSGSLAQRHAAALLARCRHGESLTRPYLDPTYIGLSHPTSVVEMIQQAVVPPVRRQALSQPSRPGWVGA